MVTKILTYLSDPGHARRRVAAVPDASTRAFTLQRQADAYRYGLSVPDELGAVCTGNLTRAIRERYARRVKLQCQHGLSLMVINCHVDR